MHATARGLVNNMQHLMDSHGGFLPNGGRSYYARPGRSQPPIFLATAFAVADATGDAGVVARAYAAAATEHAWWARTHAVTVVDARGGAHELARYATNQTTPRPEAFREDVATAARAGARGRAAEALWADIAAGAESGWDFSTRWTAPSGGRADLAEAATSRVVPADLNAFLLHAEEQLARAAAQLARPAEAAAWAARAAARKAAIDAVLWDDGAGQWRDAVVDARAAAAAGRDGSRGAPWRMGAEAALARAPAASDWAPLWAGVARGDAPRVARIVRALERSGLLARGGVLATAATSGEQWDAPNVWAPTQALVVDALARAGEASAAALARDIARRFLKVAHDAFVQSGHMNEKYDGVAGGSGDGGEYVPQVGFGWSNGVALKFAAAYDFASLDETAGGDGDGGDGGGAPAPAPRAACPRAADGACAAEDGSLAAAVHKTPAAEPLGAAPSWAAVA